METKPTTVVLFGATGDLARRKLLPGLLHLMQTGLLDDIRVVGTSLDDHDRDSFVGVRPRGGHRVRGRRRRHRGVAGVREAAALGARRRRRRTALRRTVEEAEQDWVEPGRTPAALPERARRRPRSPSCTSCDEAGLVERSRIVMEKPFGTDLASAREAQPTSCTRSSTRSRSSGSTTSSARRRRRTSSPSGSPTACSSRSGTATTSTTSRSTSPSRSGSTSARRSTRAPAPTATWSSPTCSRCWRSPRWSRRPSLEPAAISEEKNKVFRSMLADRAARRRARAVRRLPRHRRASRPTPRPRRSSPSSATSTTGAGRACRSTCAPASGWPRARGSSRSPSRSRPRSMFPAGSGVGDHGPDHLTFDLADQAKMSLSFYGKRPGPGMKLDKLSMQFAMHDTGWAGRGARGVRAADLRRRRAATAPCSRPPRASSGSGRSRRRCWRTRRSSGPYAQGSWGPNQIHQLVAPFTWRLPFERQWRDPNATGG